MKKLLIVFVFSLFAASSHAQEWVDRHLKNSPRHQEWIQTKAGDRTLHSFITFPEASKKVPVVIVIHENKGLNDWARSVTDQLAAAGYIAIAPDLLSGMGPDGGKTSDFKTPDDATKALYALKQEKVTEDLNSVFNYAKKIPAANGKVVVIGFCWGGGQAFTYAVNQPDLAAALVFYGTGVTDAESAAKIKAPVYGFYGGNDERVNATIPESEKAMKEAGKKYLYKIYDEAGHGFFRAGQDPEASEANKKARDMSYERVLEILKDI
ncbi:dienelactone hydrolase family protein [Pedobacter sp. P351]|uniref:dienelactone hydrolase family protein n=1 Tax=Pedobacter superstes TaxID=3133441 RepID=UPI0030AC872F